MSDIVAAAEKATEPPRARYVSHMFGRIAHRYDLMNTLMTLGRDRRWRRLTAALAVVKRDGLALDLGTGSGELALDMASLGCRVIAMDFCQPMMELARKKVASRTGASVSFAAGDALNLPFPGNTFDCITAGFALRNFADLGLALREMHRVLKPLGRVAALELTPPRSELARLLHGLYSHRYVPLLGRLVAGDGAAYTYLPESVDRFPDAEGLCHELLQAGFGQVSYRTLGLGMVAIHVAEKRP